MPPASRNIRGKMVFNSADFFLATLLVSAAAKAQAGPSQSAPLQQSAAARASASSQKTVQLRLKNDTLAYKLGSGLNVRSTLDVNLAIIWFSSSYVMVNGQFVAESGPVQIPN